MLQNNFKQIRCTMSTWCLTVQRGLGVVDNQSSPNDKIKVLVQQNNLQTLYLFELPNKKINRKSENIFYTNKFVSIISLLYINHEREDFKKPQILCALSSLFLHIKG